MTRKRATKETNAGQEFEGQGREESMQQWSRKRAVTDGRGRV